MTHHQKLWVTSFGGPRPCSEAAYQTTKESLQLERRSITRHSDELETY